MAVTFTVLGSGSAGNCTVISSSRTQILVDAGLSCRETVRRMRRAGLDPERTDAVLVTHEHTDHVNGVERLSRVLKVPVYMSAGTYEGWRCWARDKSKPDTLPRREEFQSGIGFNVGDIQVLPFTVPHDTNDPVGFTFVVEGVKLGLTTDLGCIPRNVVEALRGCKLLMIESNHDLEMLRTGPYPWPVKQRVMSRVGHLSNEALAEFFSNEYDNCAAYVVLAHLSEQNNHPEVARRAAQRALRCADSEPSAAKAGYADPVPVPGTSSLLLASQDEGLNSIIL